ncbi:hypothetical protein AX15_004439 [Amanita polypyramis BW_CC]|nr:hypothetical protein AX15_004439 [Amanita polypyramis BW_CC]
MDFHHLLELRVKGLVNEGREVMVVGDINACAAVIDHCEGPLMVARGQAAGMKGEEGFWEKEFRRWLRNWLVREEEVIDTMHSGCMVDIVRRFWPDRKGMYTCWNTKLSARESNYGTRIDYILTTKGLVPWIKAADIQRDIKGSDHCPVFVDLHEEITNPDGSVTRLRDVLGARTSDILPRLAAGYWDEYSGKQTQLHKFFTKKVSKTNPADTPAPDRGSQPSTLVDGVGDTTTRVTPESSQSAVTSVESLSYQDLTHATQATSLSPASPVSQLSPTLTTASPASVTSTLTSSTAPSTADRLQKRKLPAETPLERIKKQKGKKARNKSESTGSASQAKLSSFFSKPKTTVEGDSPTLGVTKSKERGVPPPTDVIDVDDFSDDIVPVNDDGFDQGIECSIHSSPFMLKDGNSNNGNEKGTWSTILAPTPIPRCTVHNEFAKEFTVNKLGPNKGKRFFICSRPVGPGYDKGRAERPREEVDPQYRCSFFKWSSDVRREVRRLGSAG